VTGDVGQMHWAWLSGHSGIAVPGGSGRFHLHLGSNKQHWKR
jgi:hypothetical protein